MDGKSASISLELLRGITLGESYFDFRDRTIVNHDAKIPIRIATIGTIKKLVFHCDDATNWTPDRLSSFFVNERKFPICGYHYYIDQNKIYHMVGENIVTYHCAPFNTESVGFSINYFASHDEPLKIPLDVNIYQNAIRTAIYLCLKFKIPPLDDSLVGHRELPHTGFKVVFDKLTGKPNLSDKTQLIKTCPGLAINLNLFRQNVCKGIQSVLKQQLELSDFAIDGIFGPKSKQMFNLLTISNV